MSLVGLLAVGLGAALDGVVGEPPSSMHPVAWFGAVVAPLDRAWRHPGAAGLGLAVLLPLGAAIPVAAVVDAASIVSPWVGGVLAGVVLFLTTSRRLLVSLAAEVVDLADGDLPAARDRLRGLAGRDASSLSAGEVRSAAVESAAENLADGLVAPLLAFTLGMAVGPAVAAGAAVWVKAVNTLDSMLGYPSKPHGAASARLDDVVMWVPARVSAALLALTSLDPGAVWRARAWAHDPPSPNSGWPMATLAAVLGVRLAKPGVYALEAGAAFPDGPTARRGVALVSRAGWASYGLAALGVVAWS